MSVFVGVEDKPIERYVQYPSAYLEKKILNIVDYFPMVNEYVSVKIRFWLGASQIMVAAAESLYRLGVMFFYAQQKEKQQGYLEEVGDLFCHGASNIIRSQIVEYSYLASLAIFIYDRILSCRFKYNCEEAESHDLMAFDLDKSLLRLQEQVQHLFAKLV